MKHALISPDEIAISYDGVALGPRVAQVTASPFVVSPPLYWVECADHIEADQFYWDGSGFQPKPVPPAQSSPDPVEGGPGVVA